MPGRRKFKVKMQIHLNPTVFSYTIIMISLTRHVDMFTSSPTPLSSRCNRHTGAGFYFFSKLLFYFDISVLYLSVYLEKRHNFVRNSKINPDG